MSEINIRDMGVAGTIIMENEVAALQLQLDQAHEALIESERRGAALVERLAQADAREAGLKLAADQYSESRDQWMLKAKAAQAEIERLISTHDRQMAESEHRGADARNDRNIMRQALDEIDKHVVGAYEVAFSDMPEPCEECGDMREIAAHALRIVKGGKG